MFLKYGRLLALLSPALLAPAQTQNPNGAPSASEQSAALAAIREYALNYTQRLPDYVCTQVRRQTISPDAQNPDGPQSRQTDVIEAQVGYVDHQDMQKITTINGKPAASADPRNLPESFSRGELKGLVYADAETQAVMRIEMQGIDFPGSSSYQSLTLKLNYKLIQVAEREFVLPSDFEFNSRQSGGTTEVDADYRNYRRFSADATIQFGVVDSGR